MVYEMILQYNSIIIMKKATVLQKNQEITLTIDAVSSDGNGIGRHEGMAVFVPYSAIGDRLRARIVKVAKQYAYGMRLDILEPSSCRIEPDCSSYGKCGGCSFRHISYEEELRLKRQFVVDSLKRIGHLESKVDDTIASPILHGYRNKVQLPVFQHTGGKLDVGFYAPRSHRIVPFSDGCRLEPRILTEIADKACSLLTEQKVSAYDESTHTGLLRHIVLRKSSVGESVLLALVLNGKSLPDEKAFAEKISAGYPQIRSIIINCNNRDTNVILGENNRTILGDGYLCDKLAGIDLRLSLPSFFQINHSAAELLYAKIREYAAPSPGDTIIDLYCGVGSIGLSLAKDVGNMIGVEIVPAAVSDAKHNAKTNGIENAEFVCSDAKDAALRFKEACILPDCVIVDPPRKGCDAATLQAIADMNPSRIVMVSCNPATLARDLARLADLGYSTPKATPVDMFPRTNHVECVAWLKRKSV